MRFDLGTLDSGERSLPFGLLVFIYNSSLSHKSLISKAFNFLVRPIVDTFMVINFHELHS